MEEGINNANCRLLTPKLEPKNYIENEEESIDTEVTVSSQISHGNKPTTQTSLQSSTEINTASEIKSEQNAFQHDESDIVSTQVELDDHNTSDLLVPRPLSNVLKSILCKASVSNDPSKSTSSIPQSREIQKDTSSPSQGIRCQMASKSGAISSPSNKSFPLAKPAESARLSNKDVVTPQMELIDPDRVVSKHSDDHIPGETQQTKLVSDKSFVCDLCEEGFNTSIALRSHRACHFRKTDVTVTDAEKLFIQCPYCSCFLQKPTKHMFEKHNAKYQETQPVKFSRKCTFCSRAMLNYRQYNSHIIRCHPDKYWSKNKSKHVTSKAGASFNCDLCNESFSSWYAVYKHKSSKHSHIIRKNTLETLQNAFEPSQKTPVNLRNLYINLSLIGAPLPKHTLFKCPICQIHFVTFSTAVEHLRRCIPKGGLKCSKCRRTFMHSERSIHALQHENSDKFKVHDFNDDLIYAIIYRCPKCKLHFYATTFWKHVSAGCVKVEGDICEICNLKMHPDLSHKHNLFHRIGPTDKYVIEFLEASIQKASSSGEQTVESRNLINEDGKRTLYFCIYCKTYTNNTEFHHIDGYCQDTCDRTSHCIACGLLICETNYTKHFLDHTLYNITLNDYTIVRMQDHRVISPPLPKFVKCHQCEVHFFDLSDKRTHNCENQEWTKCSQCFHKYCSNIYDLHLRFHEHGSGAVVSDPYSDFHFYSCVSCNNSFFNYDSILEHCQNHYIDTEFLEEDTSPCNICKLNCTSDVKRLHKMVHSNNVNFKILRFDYDKLLNEDWLKAFDSIPRVQIEQILSKSLYGNIRNVRLRYNMELLLMDGAPEITLYRCAQCELCYENQFVAEHSKEPCSRSPRYNCDSCCAAFPTEDLATKHINMHYTIGDLKCFRIIDFNYASDKELNEILRTSKKRESLKFRKCPFCDLFIKTDEFPDHVEEHRKHKLESKFLRDELIKFTIYDPTDGIKKMFTVYQCIHCKSSMRRKSSIFSHNCRDSSKITRCSKCSLYVWPCVMHKHLKVHQNLPKFITENIKVLQFEILFLDGDSVVSEITNETKETDKLNAESLSESDSQDSDMNNITSDQSKSNDSENQSSLTRRDIKLWGMLYQCHRCYMGFDSTVPLQNHLSKCVSNSSEPPLTCNQCDIIFHPSLMTLHKELHAMFVPNTVENYLYIIHIKHYPSSTSSSRHHYLDIKEWLFQCKLCDVHFLSYKALKHHIYLNHKHVNDYVKCGKCGLKFTTISCKRHMEEHHNDDYFNDNVGVQIVEKKFIMRGDFRLSEKEHSEDRESNVSISNVTENESQTADLSLEKYNEKGVANPSPNATSHYTSDASNSTSFPSTRLDRPEVTEKRVKRFRIYQCIDCEICVEKKQSRLHVCCSDIQKKHCLKCRAFKNTEFNQHLILHRKNKLSRKNFVLLKFRRRRVKNNKIFKCVECLTHFVNMNDLERHIDGMNHQTKRVYCETCSLFFGKFSFSRHVYIHHKQLKLSIEQLNILNVSTTDTSNTAKEIPETSIHTSNIPSEETSILYQQQKIFKKLFKCFDCNVCFLAKISYYQHLYKHTELDPAEYIACKICNIQFMIDDLSEHMKTHKDKSFNLENVLIEEYEPNEESPKIKICLAIDDLNSKLVSTTTSVVNKIRTFATNGEQLSTIDSTIFK